MRPFRRLTLLRLLPLATLFALAAFFGGGVVTDDARAADGVFGAASCTGGTACDSNTGTIGANSCNGFDACDGNTGTIGDDSCNGYEACKENAGTIGASSCNGGFLPCKQNGGSGGTGEIGDG
ncbi:MAG: hypothetical protein ACKVVT_16820, partial [Dehalococcoidia bacterium]